MKRFKSPGAPAEKPHADRPQPDRAPAGRPHGKDRPKDRPKDRAGGTGRPALLYGLHPVMAAWTNPERRVRQLLVTESGLEAMAEALAQAGAAGLARPEPTVVGRHEIDRRVPPGAVHQGVALEAAPLPETSLDDICRAATGRPLIVLDQVTDPHNVGAILRSAAAFGATAVIVTERHAPADVTGVLAKSASGALEAVPLVRVTNLARALEDLQQAGYWCVGLAESGTRTLAQMTLTANTALVLGAEGSGLRRLTMERCDDIARLPTQGPIGSLNVSNAAAVALYELARLDGGKAGV